MQLDYMARCCSKWLVLTKDAISPALTGLLTGEPTVGMAAVASGLVATSPAMTGLLTGEPAVGMAATVSELAVAHGKKAPFVSRQNLQAHVHW